MFTVLSNTRNSNLYLAAALAIAIVALLTFAVAPAISAPQPVAAPMARLSEAGSDYYLRHPELRISAALATYIAGDFYLRHPEWASNVQNATIPVTGISAAGAPLDECIDVSIGELAACRSAAQTPVLTPGLACESPVDCR